jgi:hypothetical protein
MNSGIFWLFALFAIEAAMFVFTLYLVRMFTRSHDREWPAQDTVPSTLDGHAPTAGVPQAVAGERGRIAAVRRTVPPNADARGTLSHS